MIRHADRLTEACNKVALLLVSNTPFYPLYLWFILGRDFHAWMLLTALSLPFFAAALFVAPRHGLASRVWLCGFASLNSFWVSWLLGPQAGVMLFFLPCLVLAVLAFRANEFLPRALLTALPFVLYLVLQYLPHAPGYCTPAEFASLFKLNAVSVTLLSVVLPYLLGNARGEGDSCRQVKSA